MRGGAAGKRGSNAMLPYTYILRMQAPMLDGETPDPSDETGIRSAAFAPGVIRGERRNYGETKNKRTGRRSALSFG